MFYLPEVIFAEPIIDELVVLDKIGVTRWLNLFKHLFKEKYEINLCYSLLFDQHDIPFE